MSTPFGREDNLVVPMIPVALKEIIQSKIGVDAVPPWKSLYVFEQVQENLQLRVKFWEDAIRKALPHSPSDPESPTSPYAYIRKARDILDVGKTGQVIHLRKTPLKLLYETPPHPEQPFEETVRPPFSKLFLEFSEPLEVQSGPYIGTDILVALVMHESEPGKIVVYCIWQDCEFTELFIDTSLLPEYAQMPCDMATKPPTSEPCWREMAIAQDPAMEKLPVCPAIMDSNVNFRCAHRWRDKIVGLFINIITLLNARNLVLERIETPKKRMKRARKDGIQLPAEYRKVELDWFTMPRKSSHSEGTGTGRERTAPYLRRGHFRQYSPGKFTWVTAHICRADLATDNAVKQKVYRA